MRQVKKISAARQPGRPREFDIDDAIDSAIDVFRERGFHATSIADLVRGLQLTRGSVYKAFKDKLFVFLAAYDRYVAARNHSIDNILKKAASGKERLAALLTLYADLAAGDDGRRGCLVVATAVELTLVDPEISARVVSSFGRTKQLIASLIDQGKADGSVPETVDGEATAELMLCLLQGMRLIGKATPDHDKMMRVVNQALKLVE